ncbi:MAG: response regulator [Bacteroidales bacterium]|nr:response regulator [Bacteroidales bacterium]
MESINKKYDWSDKTILIAEDVESNYLLLEVLLRKTKAKIIRAEDGEEVVDIFKASIEKSDNKKPFDLILMDIKMPKMNGYIATRIIKNICKEKNMDIPIIAQTAFAMSNERDLSIKAGCDDYIPKPIRSSLLFEIIDKWI